MTINYKLEEVELVAKKLLETATSKILLFEGEMGVGKTTLIKTLVKLLGSNDVVSSPTFALVNEYIGDTNTIYHFDLYRIETEDELYDFGIDTYIDSDHYVFVEWPTILKPLIQDQFTIVNISLSENTTRQLRMKNFD
ncbi:tRNA (adenosine(37)-N6)-threonylcarbamoyltransferase complex ATPase subunit type 1 TsaE [Olleya sp. Bg11-27]|uniref:tRNA (adenosine(37)-N6)-threonylcarbamoyltransferase complex ATPase subunit type 1 TsaE n=1 Tax=Olleya sp. Bg11-27 TaxID=2058135 RepID=UPI000C300D22|nr:tRNA (adenosine(37)-N6)-threonylcarbamoyltransferase complex ATPase subunit type 1 TsaE [Olleya sp. Bg11-27]AUC76635.1 tRNA (adenosine(37)-N6)-threonylcarbamoyltransferase complex ATPase subunit type 1 TsaE [Olleya sp. Bg11-27]